MIKILISDDDQAIRLSLEFLLQDRFSILQAESPEETLETVISHNPDLILLDMNFSLNTSGREGIELLQQLKSDFSHIPVILITAWGSIELAVEGMKIGAADFITKPWNNEVLLQSIETALLLKADETEYYCTRQKLEATYDFSQIVGEDPVLCSLLQAVGRISKTDATVLITGESGTGKELFARAIHQNSKRKNKPMIEVNVGGVPPQLFETEMFGHKKGAFTDAHTDRVGRFELAEGGTIFLDEIGDIDHSSQVKLLRVLQNKSFERVGESKTRFCNVRIICATNRNLPELVSEQKFREDLYYRLNVIQFEIPPLCHRKTDIPLLVQHFLKIFQREYNLSTISMKGDVLEFLKNKNWPGNIRELRNVLERTVLMSGKSELEVADFGNFITYNAEHEKGTSSLPDIGSMTLEDIEKAMIEKAIEHHSGNMSQIARSLGLSRGALYRRLEKYGLQQ